MIDNFMAFIGLIWLIYLSLLVLGRFAMALVQALVPLAVVTIILVISYSLLTPHLR